MSKLDKLLGKLQNKKISTEELANLLLKLGWTLKRQKGSHQQWLKDGGVITLSPHGKEVARYQIKMIKERLGL